jgi:hypothetical protein
LILEGMQLAAWFAGGSGSSGCSASNPSSGASSAWLSAKLPLVQVINVGVLRAVPIPMLINPCFLRIIKLNCGD